MTSILITIPMFGKGKLTDALLEQLVPDTRSAKSSLVDVLVVDNRGDYSPPHALSVEVYRPSSNLQWIGSSNVGLRRGIAGNYDACLLLNNDIRVSPGFVDALVAATGQCCHVGVLAPAYDCYWPHQRSVIAARLETHRPTCVHRRVPFCDGTALLVPNSTIHRVGLLDEEAFPWHGYGADVDYGLRVRRAGLSCWVTEMSFVSHMRRSTMSQIYPAPEARIREEFRSRLEAKWGPDWRVLTGIADLPQGTAH